MYMYVCIDIYVATYIIQVYGMFVYTYVDMYVHDNYVDMCILCI